MSATRKMVSRAATDESTGEVRDIRTRKEPENTRIISWGGFFYRERETYWRLPKH
jgi:hypothetical protein